jgi:hypothetical protein
MTENKINIIIWGCNSFSKALFRHLENTSIVIIGFISDDHIDINNSEDNKINFFCGKQVYSPHEFKKLKHYRDFPILIATYRRMFFKVPILRAKHISQFKEKLQEITHHYHIQNELLHPAALTDFIPLRMQHKPILFGLQGAGNVLFNQLFLQLCKAQLPLVLTRDKRTLFFEILCREYLQMIQQVMLDHIHLHEGHSLHHIAWKIGTSHFNYLYGKNNVPCSIYTFNTREHVAQFTAMYHQLPSVTYLRKLQNMRFKTFLIVRNPLDMILSGINKTGGMNKTNNDINMHHFYGAASWVINQLNDWHPRIQHLNVLRYEDLILAPIKTIKSIMKHLHLWPSNYLAKKMWGKIKFRQLPNAFKHHFWQGGCGKWELFFNQKHLIILKALGIEKVLRDYQYQDVYTKFKTLTGDLSNIETSTSLITENKKNIFYRDELYDTFEFLKEMHGEEHCIKCSGLILVCNDPETLQHLSTIFKSTYFNKIIFSGTHKSHRIV